MGFHLLIELQWQKKIEYRTHTFAQGRKVKREVQSARHQAKYSQIISGIPKMFKSIKQPETRNFPK